eukprot:CAMPEP_0119336208 /NCGR_PEP_ID=MMETSP1333-20130426/91336_1 /TAXON_ID=418940 /ORGANISM="Scyphosphaera apsteinii, Strain RCC1455" /LENGTH=76 /DNA_ID=CAMNT_0007346965 /DNA_START=71 /DNA_END=302 /DNA_ORIENTATION=-
MSSTAAAAATATCAASLVLMHRDLKRRTSAAFEKALNLPPRSVVEATITRTVDVTSQRASSLVLCEASRSRPYAEL